MEEHDAGWEDLRREARKLEGDLDMKLSSYAKLGGMLAHGGHMEKGSASADVLGADGSWKSMEMEIASLLEKLVDVNDSMSHCAVAAAPTTSVSQKLARHRDILHEFTQEFKRTRGNINSLREHAELLTSVRNDISEYRASGSSSPGPSLLRERAAIHGNIGQIEEVIIQAQSTKTVLSTQRSMFMEIQVKAKHLSDRFPIIRSVLGAIRRKRSRDTLILSAVIAACTLFLFIYWLFK